MPSPRSQPLVGRSGQASIHGIPQPHQLLHRFIDRRVDGGQGFLHGVLHPQALGGNDRGTDRLLVDLVKIRPLVQVEQPIGLAFPDQSPNAGGKITHGLVLVIGLREIAVEVSRGR